MVKNSKDNIYKNKIKYRNYKIIIETKTVLFYLLSHVYAGLQSERSQEKRPKHFQNCYFNNRVLSSHFMIIKIVFISPTLTAIYSILHSLTYRPIAGTFLVISIGCLLISYTYMIRFACCVTVFARTRMLFFFHCTGL